MVLIGEGGGEGTLSGDDRAGSDEEKGGELRPHRSAGERGGGGVSGEKTCVGKRSRGKVKNRRWLEDVKVIPTDGMFTESDFSRPCLPDIPVSK